MRIRTQNYVMIIYFLILILHYIKMKIPNQILVAKDLDEAKKLQVIGQKKLFKKINWDRLIM